MSNFYCAAPWRGLHINPRGDVKTCCAGDPNMLGNLNAHSIEQILDGELLKEIRTTIASGRPHEYCSNCVKAERFGGSSERAWHNRVNANFDYSSAGNTYHWPTIIDVRWNTTCNLSCNYCGPSCSSKWAALKNIPFKSGARPYYEQVCDYLDRHKKHIKEVALVGGEPLLLPENERLLDVIPDDCVVTLITNMSVDLDSNKVFAKLAQRTRVGWSMSFDNTDKHFEYVRHGGNWELLKNNLSIVKSLMKNNGHWGGIHAVYNLYNATKICELKKFAHEQNLSVVWQNLFQPDYLDPLLHGVEIAVLAREEILKFMSLDSVTESEKVFFNTILKKYQSITEPNLVMIEKFSSHINDVETKYHLDQVGKFADLWPELYQIIKSANQYETHSH